MKCQVESYAVSSSQSPLGPALAVTRCRTHNFDMTGTIMTDGTMCPLGRIEDATEKALAAIKAAQERKA